MEKVIRCSDRGLDNGCGFCSRLLCEQLSLEVVVLFWSGTLSRLGGGLDNNKLSSLELVLFAVDDCDC